MGLRNKPQQTAADSERRVNELIEKGGTVASAPEDSGKPQLVQLRLPRDIVERIDNSRNRRTVPPSRHSWLLEALLEKLKADDR